MIRLTIISIKINDIKSLNDIATVKIHVKFLKPFDSRKCPICGSSLSYLKSLNSYYCFNCKSYVY